MGEWRTIDSAPKDGTRVLVDTVLGVFIAWWDDDYWEDAVRTFNGGPPLKPLHWMPLPEPPQ
jgi:hypothetical protein